jgi:uncharacterized membrane protein
MTESEVMIMTLGFWSVELYEFLEGVGAGAGRKYNIRGGLRHFMREG